MVVIGWLWLVVVGWLWLVGCGWLAVGWWLVDASASAVAAAGGGAQELLAADGAAGDLFGFSLSLYANSLAVGAPDAAVTAALPRAGAVYAFERAS